jgi:hypothetical protein
MTAPAIVTANKKNLLALISAAVDELALRTPTAIVANGDPQIKQFLALAKREGREFYALGQRNGGWQQQRGEYQFATSVSSLTGTTTSGSTIITGISSTTGLTTDFAVSGTGIATNSRIASVDSATQVTMDVAATASGTVTLTFAQDQYAMPTDFGYFINGTWWDRDQRWQMLGPLTAQEWQQLKSGLSTIGPRRMFRIYGNKLAIHPVPDEDAQTLVFEYYSSFWCQSSTGTAKIEWSADTDYYNLDDDAFILGMKWRIKAAKGLDYVQEKMDYDMHTERLMSDNGGNRILPMNAQNNGAFLLGYNNIPDTGYGA